MPRSTGGALQTREPVRARRRRGARLHRIAVDIRPLSYGDLPEVIAIERRSFPAPWSLAMFVLELSKPTSICLGARNDGELTGYLMCSRYHTVWHLMNVAVDLDRRRLGIASRLMEHLFQEAGDHERYTL